jgi:hypothetical protein
MWREVIVTYFEGAIALLVVLNLKGPRWTSVLTSGLKVEIRTRDFPNTDDC